MASYEPELEEAGIRLDEDFKQNLFLRVDEERKMRQAGGVGPGQFEHLNVAMESDPFKAVLPRPAILTAASEALEVLVLGAGFGGLLTAVRLREAGIGSQSIRIVDKAGDVGGTWYWNRYPDAACDIESYLYMPIMEEMGHAPSEKFAGQPEIYRHCVEIARRHGIYDSCLFHTTITHMAWDDQRRLWVTSTDRGDRFLSRHVVLAPGNLSRPRIPKIEGLDTFAGAAFHTARWNFEATGEHLEKLAGLRVGLVGTGSSGCQSTQRLAEAAGHLTVFQRTPPQVFPEPNTPIDKNAVAQLEPGWSTKLRTNFDLVVGGSTGVGDRNESDLHENFNRLVESSAIEFKAVGGAQRLGLRELRRVNAKNQAEILTALHREIDATVEDKQIAESLKPYYYLGCKRPVIHPGYLPAFNRPNVRLLSSGISKLTERGAVADSGEYVPLDVIIFATGFEPGNLSIYNKIIGENDLAFDDKVGHSIASTSESSTYLGIHSRGFPNLMIMQGPQCVRPFNMTSLLEQQSVYFARVVKHCRSHAIEKFQPTEDAERRWVQQVSDSQSDDGGFLENCTPGWYNNHGQVDGIKKSSMAYGAGPQAYYSILSEVQFEDNFESLHGGTCKL